MGKKENKQKVARKPVDFNAITIDDGIPIPKVRSNHTGRYPFDALAVGQSFAVECEKVEAKKVLSGLRGAAKRATERTGHEFYCGLCEKGVRCWRVERPEDLESAPGPSNNVMWCPETETPEDAIADQD